MGDKEVYKMRFIDFLIEEVKKEKPKKKKVPSEGTGYGTGGKKNPKTWKGWKKKSSLADFI